MDFSKIRFPKVKRISPMTLAQHIQSKTNEQVAEELGKMLKSFEEETGYKVIIEKGTSPIQSLFPNKNKE